MKKTLKIITVGLVLLSISTFLWLVFGPDKEIDASELSDTSLISHTLDAIKAVYLDKDRVEPYQMLESALNEVQKEVPEILAEFKNKKEVKITVDMASKSFSITKLNSLKKLDKTLKEIFEFIDSHYNGDKEREKIEYAAIEGILSSLDPHSGFLSPEVYKEFKVGTKGKFGGIGIVISIKDGALTVIAPMDGTPAKRAGVKAGDKIVQINDESAVNMSLTDAVNRLRGKVGTDVSLVIERAGASHSIPIKLKRAVINIDSVQYDLIKMQDKKIGYIKVKSFQDNTDDEVLKAIKYFQENGPLQGLILDLRNNPGGLLTQAISLADNFLSKGIIVSTVGKDDQVFESNNAKKNKDDFNGPLAVLINEGSASASEIVAGAIKELDRGIVIGQRSFGKGSVQTIFDLDVKVAIKLTIAKYLPAGTYTIQSVGLAPDIELIPVNIEKENIDLFKNTVFSEKDLDKHLESSAKDEKPSYSIKYLDKKQEEEDIEKIGAREYAKKPYLEDDFAVGFAKNLLIEAQQTNRNEMLDSSSKLVDKVLTQEEKKIIKKLEELKVDWSTNLSLRAKRGNPAVFSASYRIIKDGKPVNSINAGEEVMLEIKVTNTSDKEIFRLAGISKSDIGVVTDKEFIFGKIKPKENRIWQTQIKVPQYFPDSELQMKVEFKNGNKKLDNDFIINLPIKGHKMPIFGFSYMLKNKKIMKNKKITLEMKIKNIGKGASSKDTVATLSNKSGENLFIEEGRVKLGEIAPNQTKNVVFKFHLEDNFVDNIAEFDLAVIDSANLEVISQKISINISNASIAPLAEKFYAPPKIIFNKYPFSTEKEHININGFIEDDKSIKDYYLYVGSKKIAYVSNPEKINKKEFNISIPLEPGNNIINVSARDDTNLVGRSYIFINRTTGENDFNKKDHLTSMPSIKY